MIEVIKKEDGSSVIKLSKFERIWFCSECNKEFKIAPTQCSCGAVDKVFLEKDLPYKEADRSEYKVESNIIFEAEQILKGKVVSLPIKDFITQDLLKRKLISEIPVKIEDIKFGPSTIISMPTPEVRVDNKTSSVIPVVVSKEK